MLKLVGTRRSTSCFSSLLYSRQQQAHQNSNDRYDDKQLDKAERKQLQISKSAQLSDRAKIVKLGDMICNVTDVASNPPVDWPLERRIEYLAWTEQVARGCRGVHERLEKHYETALGDAREVLGRTYGSGQGVLDLGVSDE